MSQKALLIIDMLNDFLTEGGALFCGEEAKGIIPFVKGVIKEFRKENTPILYIKDTHKENDPEFKLFKAHCVKGSFGAQVIDEIKPAKDDIQISKTTYDAYYNSDLGNVLKEKSITEVCLVGVCTSICVMETASSLAKRGYKVFVYKKGVADFDQKAHEFALQRMQSIYGATLI